MKSRYFYCFRIIVANFTLEYSEASEWKRLSRESATGIIEKEFKRKRKHSSSIPRKKKRSYRHLFRQSLDLYKKKATAHRSAIVVNSRRKIFSTLHPSEMVYRIEAIKNNRIPSGAYIDVEERLRRRFGIRRASIRVFSESRIPLYFVEQFVIRPYY